MLRQEFSFGEAPACVRSAGLLGSVLFHREQAGTPARPGKTLTIRLADSSGDRDQAGIILNRMYGRRGYGSHHRVAQTSNSATFTACSDEAMIGTLTLSVDSAAGLGVDETFPEELAEFRSEPGASLCELTKFAYTPSTQSRPSLAMLFHIIFIYGTQRFDCTDLLIEVNPRHVCFYEVMLRFKRVGPVRTNLKVDAPSQLMHLKVADIRTYIDLFVDGESPASHSLYRYFFDRQEEQEIRSHIAALPEPGRVRIRTKAGSNLAAIGLAGRQRLRSLVAMTHKKEQRPKPLLSSPS